MSAVPSTDAEVEAVLRRAHGAFRPWARTPREGRALALEAVAQLLENEGDELVALAAEETHLGPQRLRGELSRTTFQLRMFADVLRDGGYLEVRIDHADPAWPMGVPRPDLRRTMVPLGPVVVFAGSNFPFAVSVAGGDTASALAAGCPVIVKAHSGHPLLSARTADAVRRALAGSGAPHGVFGMVQGTAAGVTALGDPRVKAGAFTGSIAGGRSLFDVAVSRPEPIPFFGELGSTNPVFVTRAADDARAAQIAEGFLGSMTLSAGQFCTKPGVLFVPRGSRIPAALQDASSLPRSPLLNTRIAAGYAAAVRELRAHPAVDAISEGAAALSDPPSPTVLRVDMSDFLSERDRLMVECFGPTALVVTYEDEADLVETARQMDGQLTATLVAQGAEPVLPELVDVLTTRVGRLLWNQWPTGVAVTAAQQHGGPYPASTAPATTSVGAAAIGRFLRPIAYQGFPRDLLPPELRDGA